MSSLAPTIHAVFLLCLKKFFFFSLLHLISEKKKNCSLLASWYAISTYQLLWILVNEILAAAVDLIFDRHAKIEQIRVVSSFNHSSQLVAVPLQTTTTIEHGIFKC